MIRDLDNAMGKNENAAIALVSTTLRHTTKLVIVKEHSFLVNEGWQIRLNQVPKRNVAPTAFGEVSGSLPLVT
jgi:hypothetical protein